jgi:hypothetical protein
MTLERFFSMELSDWHKFCFQECTVSFAAGVNLRSPGCFFSVPSVSSVVNPKEELSSALPQPKKMCCSALDKP